MRAHEVGFECPARGVGVEVAEEDVDEEGALQRHFLDPDVRDPFPVVARCESLRRRGHVGGLGRDGGDTGSHGGGERRVCGFGGGSSAEGWEGGVRGAKATGLDGALLRDGFAGGGAVELVDGRFGRGRGPAAGFRVIIAEGGGVAGGLGGPEGAGGVFVEGFEGSSLVDGLAGFEDCGAVFDFLWGHPIVGVDGLPDGEEAVDVSVMQPENRVEGGVVDLV